MTFYTNTPILIANAFKHNNDDVGDLIVAPLTRLFLNRLKDRIVWSKKAPGGPLYSAFCETDFILIDLPANEDSDVDELLTLAESHAYVVVPSPSQVLCDILNAELEHFHQIDLDQQHMLVSNCGDEPSFKLESQLSGERRGHMTFWIPTKLLLGEDAK